MFEHQAISDHEWDTVLREGHDQRWDLVLPRLASYASRVHGLEELKFLWIYARAHRFVGRHEKAREIVYRFHEKWKRSDILLPPWLSINILLESDELGLIDVAQAVLPFVADSDLVQFPKIKDRLDLASAITAECRTWPFAIVSLGRECMPFDLCMRWGLQPRTVDGPFMHGAFPIRGVLAALEDNFAAFSDPSGIASLQSPNGASIAHIKKYSALFNHELGPHFSSNEWSNFILLYQARIEKQNLAIATSPVVFLIQRSSDIDIDLISAAIERRYSGSTFALAIIDDFGDNVFDVQFGQDLRAIFSISVTKPAMANYVWHKPEYYNSFEGCEFESRIVMPLFEFFCEYALKLTGQASSTTLRYASAAPHHASS